MSRLSAASEAELLRPPPDTRTPTRKRRLQMDISQAAYDRLNRLKDMTDASSFAEVFRNALKLYQLVAEARLQGKNLALQDPDTGRYEPVHWFEG